MHFTLLWRCCCMGFQTLAPPDIHSAVLLLCCCTILLLSPVPYLLVQNVHSLVSTPLFTVYTVLYDSTRDSYVTANFISVQNVQKEERTKEPFSCFHVYAYAYAIL